MRTLLLTLLFLVYHNAYPQEYRNTYFSKKEVTEDLVFLKNNLSEIHPLFNDEEFLNKWIDKYTNISKNIPDSVTFNNSYIIFSSLISMLKDGHSNFVFPYTERMKYMKNKGVTMPFSVEIKNNKIYLDKYLSEKNKELVIGSEILSINNISNLKILEDMQVFYGAKKTSVINHNIAKYFGAYFWTLYGVFDTYTLKLVKNEKKYDLTLKGIQNSEYFSLKNKLYPKKAEKKYDLIFLDSLSFAVLKIKSFADKQRLPKYLSKAFESIKAHRSQNLIIDIRDNWGGTSSCVDTLLSYLTNKPYKQYKSIGLKISDTIKSKYKQRDLELFDKIKNKPKGQIFYYSEDMLHKSVLNRNNRFKGNVFVLINDKTYSASATFTGVMKHYNLAKIVGFNATGGTIEYYGDFIFLTLPNTKMSFFVSPKVFVQYGNKEINNGVLPDIMVRENQRYKDIVKMLKLNNQTKY